MGPTCSIIYENEPMEQNTMSQKPRPFTTTFFSMRELATSMVQGLAITAGALLVYQYALLGEHTEALTRTLVFTYLIAANIFLTLHNRSFYFSILTTLRWKNNLIPLIIGITVGITALMLFVGPIRRFFGFETISIAQLGVCIGMGALFVLWYEGVKWWKRRKG